MGRRKIVRTPEEEEEYKRKKREDRREYQRAYRAKVRNNNKNAFPQNLNVTNSTVEVEKTVDVISPTVENLTEVIEPHHSQQQQQHIINEVSLPQASTSVNNDDRIILAAMNVNNIKEHYGGKMNFICQHCNAKHFKCEIVPNKKDSFNDCCSHGKVQLEALPQLPPELLSLFVGTHPKSHSFFERIRVYNNSFSFASFNANLFNFQSRRGPYCFRIQGQIYYQVNTSAYPQTNELPSYGQLFIVDSNEAINSIKTQHNDLDREVLDIIDRTMRENNIFAQSYQMMGEELLSQQQQSNVNNAPPHELHLLFTLKPGVDRNRYNFQRTNEVAAVFSTTADGEIPDSYVTIRNKNTKKLQSINILDPNVEPWIYPLFYAHGTRGWNKDLTLINTNVVNNGPDQRKTRTRLTREAYTRYRIAIRDNDPFNPILLGRRLFQQWIVDSYVKVEKDRLNWIKYHQKEIRAESYSGLTDYLQTVADQNDASIGKVVILPSSFSGSPRNMMQHYQDAMTIVRKFGKPDLFITMTCNPNWTEIKENLLPGQQPSDRPDLCARVFAMKKKRLLHLLLKDKVFGEVAAHVYVVESQKRGLLHSHHLVILKNKLITVEKIDKIVSAEIPDPNLYPELHKIILKNMIHGPCDVRCFKDGKCSKKFPKKFQAETTLDERSCPTYRRRDTGRSYQLPGGRFVDNQWVVPYCPTLSTELNCHINVEVVTSSNAPKYLYKYVYKGHDAALITVSNNPTTNSETNREVINTNGSDTNREIINPNGSETNRETINQDEVHNHIETRYIGPNEAYWHICDKKMQETSHPVQRLCVHLPNEQNIILPANPNDASIRQAMDRTTTLLAYFELNDRDPTAHQYTYPDIPSFYTYKDVWINGNKVKRWKIRENSFNSIGRMYSVSPSQTELFHLRLLLLHVKGAKSFEDLRTVDGKLCDSFMDACAALHFIEDDDEWRRAIEEAANWMMPCQLRKLYVRILIHCHPLDPKKLWEEFKIQLSEDYSRQISQEMAEKKAYSVIAHLLSRENYDISEFKGMEPAQNIEEIELEIHLAEYTNRGMEQYGKLNNVQKLIVDEVLNTLDNGGDQNCFYINGPGGSGKTFIYNTLYYLIKSRGKGVSTMAFTGIAAILLPEGKTVHKTFGLPIPLDAYSTSSIGLRTKQANYLENIDVFIWDEASMAPRYALNVADRLLRDIMKNDEPFGGKIFILGGDFRQLLPVNVNGTRSETVNLSIKFSDLWQHFRTYSLTENMRVLPNEQEFAKFLLDVGDGVLNDSNDNLAIPVNCISNSNDIVHNVYGELLKNNKYKEGAKCAILSARNLDVDEINLKVVDLLDKESEKIYTSVDTLEQDQQNEHSEVILTEYLNTLSPSSLPPHQLRLRKYCIVMLIRNLSINEGLCNGTRLLILELGNTVLRCEILTGDRKGEIVFINRISITSDRDYSFTFRRRQFPIKIAYAMTINKAQGQTFEKIGIDLRKDVFNHGQLYVALSRVRCWDSLKIYFDIDRNEKTVKNYVYTELYQ